MTNFIEELKESNIKSHSASISIQRDEIVQNLEAILIDPAPGMLPGVRKCVDQLKAITENDIDLRIIDPTIGIATALYLIFSSSIDHQKLLVQNHRDEFKKALLGVLEIARYTKDTRVSDYSMKAADAFTENYPAKK